MKIRTRTGFTLLELVVALGITGLMVAAAMETFRMQNETYTVVDQTTEIQQNMRAIAHLLERDIRSTGSFVAEGFASCGLDAANVPDNAPDVLFVTDVDPIFAFDGVGNMVSTNPVSSDVTVVSNNFAPGNAVLTLDSVILENGGNANPFYDTDANGVADSDFQVGGGVIIISRDNPEVGSACATITAVNPPNSLNVTFITGNPVPGPWIAVPAHVYQIVVQVPPAVPGTFLQRDGVNLAADVEDLQVSWFIDDGGGAIPLASDGLPVPNETRGANGSPVYIAADPAPAGTDHRRLKEIRVNLVVRTRMNAPGSSDVFISAGPQAMENRGFVPAPNDGFRRRVHTTSVRLRSVGWRGALGSQLEL